MTTPGGTATSSSFTVPPANNNFGAATVVGSVPATFSVSTAGATLQSGEPTACNGSPIPIGRTVWYRFTPTSSMNVTIDMTTSDADFDTIVAVYTGSSLSTLTPVACNDDTPGGSLQAQVSFAATAGTTYQIQIGGYNQDFGNLVVSFTPTASGAAPARAASAAAATKAAPPRDPGPLEVE